MRTLYNRECGIIEAADVCLMNSLYGTDNDTVIKWLNFFMIRNKSSSDKSNTKTSKRIGRRILQFIY